MLNGGYINIDVWSCSHYAKLCLFCKKKKKKSVNTKPFLMRTSFSPTKIFAIETKLQRCSGLTLGAANFLPGEKILCSLTSILHRVIIFRNEFYAAYLTVPFSHNLSEVDMEQHPPVVFMLFWPSAPSGSGSVRFSWI